MPQARDERQDELTDTELQRDKATTEWADATRAQTELESKIRRMSDKLKDAEKTSAQLRDQVATVRNQHKQLVLKRDRGLSEREMVTSQRASLSIENVDMCAFLNRKEVFVDIAQCESVPDDELDSNISQCVSYVMEATPRDDEDEMILD
ncbi:hypothetical protein PInf_022758 [Phytophthora infestans]|nr:hypothetical protein PInf_022758 [Phytophthora infestans]